MSIYFISIVFNILITRVAGYKDIKLILRRAHVRKAMAIRADQISYISKNNNPDVVIFDRCKELLNTYLLGD